jgi:hypothetical protein
VRTDWYPNVHANCCTNVCPNCHPDVRADLRANVCPERCSNRRPDRRTNLSANYRAHDVAHGRSLLWPNIGSFCVSVGDTVGWTNPGANSRPFDDSERFSNSCSYTNSGIRTYRRADTDADRIANCCPDDRPNRASVWCAKPCA